MTQAQNQARKQNARHSTGPKTEEGKQKSSMNAVKHGLFIKGDYEMDITEIDDTQYNDLLASLIDHYNPQNPLEQILIERIARLKWRLERVSMAEKKAMQATPGVEHSLPPAGALERILRYERTMDRELHGQWTASNA